MSEEDLARETVAFRAGYEDRFLRRGHFGLDLLMMGDTSDGELSDYWYGWHQAGRDIDAAPRKRRAKR